MSKPKDPTVIDQYVAEKIKEARLDAGYTQDFLAQLLGLATMQVHKYETGQDRITSGRLHSIAAMTCKPVAWFFP